MHIGHRSGSADMSRGDAPPRPPSARGDMAIICFCGLMTRLSFPEITGAARAAS